MNSLTKFQIDFINATLFNNKQAAYSLNKKLKRTSKLTTNDQISIYTNGINNGLINALRNIYPVCEKLVGNDFFHILGLAYIRDHPSLSPDLANYGNDFSFYISTYNAASSVPYLSDIAKLEWFYHRAFNSKDEAEFDINMLGRYTAEQLTNCVFSLPASHKLLKSNYPVDEIWRINLTENETELTLTNEPVYLFLYRKKHEIHIDKITKNEFIFLKKIESQQSFLKISEQLPDTIGLSKLLVKSLQSGWINQAQMPV